MKNNLTWLNFQISWLPQLRFLLATVPKSPFEHSLSRWCLLASFAVGVLAPPWSPRWPLTCGEPPSVPALLVLSSLAHLPEQSPHCLPQPTSFLHCCPSGCCGPPAVCPSLSAVSACHCLPPTTARACLPASVHYPNPPSASSHYCQSPLKPPLSAATSRWGHHSCSLLC